jgi:hypothetical protein
MNHISRRTFLAFLPPVLVASAAEREPRAYNTGYSHIMKLGRDLHSGLAPDHREKIAVQPISIETDPAPFAKLLYFDDQPKPTRGVWISAGFIDLVNHVAHAKAIDRREKNYFNLYLEVLSGETGQQPLRPLPNIDHAKYWTQEILNDQQSNFNSIVGMVVGMKLANHYLGHHDKYKADLDRTAINNLLTPAEFEEAFRHGLRNALRAGCMTEGAVPFFEAFDKMKKRPVWTAHFLPDKIKFSTLRKETESIQQRFLAGED